MALNSKFAGLVLKDGPTKMTVLSPWDSMPIVHQGTGEECWIEVHSPQGDVGKAVDRKQMDKNLRRRNARPSVRDVETGVCEKLAGLTKSWLLAMPDGTPIDEPCTFENALALYTDVLWLREQVGGFINDLGNFRPTPSENSSTTLSMNSDSAA